MFDFVQAFICNSAINFTTVDFYVTQMNMKVNKAHKVRSNALKIMCRATAYYTLFGMSIE
jgi:hypothetical protein